MAIEWDERYRIGDQTIDEEHQELFQIAGRFLNATSQESRRATAAELRSYTKKHFSHEEMLMHDVGYPFIATHVKLHDNLIARLDWLTTITLAG